jgi:hypothetical protein
MARTRLIGLGIALLALALPSGLAPAGAAGGGDSLALVDWGSRFHLFEQLAGGASVATFYYGNPGDVPLMGDWNCDGVATPGMYRPSNGFVYLRNSNTQGVADLSFFYGNPADIPLAGDFDGDGCDTVAVYRASEGKVYIRNTLGTGVADNAYYFGGPGYTPFAGDFDGDGIDTVGLYKESTGWVHLGNSLTSGVSEWSFVYGNPGDRILAGDWDADGRDTVAVYRSSTGILYLKLSNTSGPADQAISGLPADGAMRPLAVRGGSVVPSGFGASIPSGYVAIYPGQGIQATVNAYPEGTAFLIKAGTHVGQTVVPKSGNTFLGEPGAVLDGGGARFAFYGKASNVSIKGLTITNYNNDVQLGAVKAGGHDTGEATFGWVVEGNEIAYNTGGIRIGSTMVVRGNNIHHNRQIGIAGIGEGTLIEGNTIAYNNPSHEFNQAWEAGGTKFVKTRDLVVRNNHVHHNNGPGLWTDIDSINTLYEGNLVQDNEGPGINHEISYEAVIRYNTVERNGFGRSGWLWGAGIQVSSSRGAEIYGNTVAGNRNGIAGAQQSRGSGTYGPHEISNLYVHDNLVVLGDGGTGLVQDIGDPSYFTSRNNRFERNTYQLGSLAKPFAWQDGWQSFQQWQGFGQDQGGSAS